MAELSNCPDCGDIFIKNLFRENCEKCFKEEERMYEIVYQFLRQRKNRAATMDVVIRETGASEKMLYKWIRKGRLQRALFPNLGYPCEKCGNLIQEGKLCKNCISQIKKDLDIFEEEKNRQQEIQERERSRTYYSVDERFKGK